MDIIRFKKLNKGALVGVADVYLPHNKMEIYGLTLWNKAGKTWVNFPATPFQDDKGETKYAPHVRIRNTTYNRAFHDAFMKALHEHEAKNQNPPSEQAK